MRTFPIFVSFDGRPPLVVGGGELAAIKARLLLKRARRRRGRGRRARAGACEACQGRGEVRRSSQRPASIRFAAGRLSFPPPRTTTKMRVFRPSPARSAFRSTCPTGQSFAPLRLPAIVDRGEVTVAIGTSGAAPVLAQRLRAWLERELHPRLDALAKLAAEFRGASRRGAAGGQRASPLLGRLCSTAPPPRPCSTAMRRRRAR